MVIENRSIGNEIQEGEEQDIYDYESSSSRENNI